MRVTMKQAILHGERTDAPDHKDGKPWKHDAFTVTIECEGRTLETPWKQGIGLRQCPGRPHSNERARSDGKFYTMNDWRPGVPRKPTAEDVLSSLLMDATGTEGTFEDWCGDYGEDTDSRRALNLYLLLQENAKKLRVFLGMDAAVAIEKFGDGDSEAAAKALCAETVPSS